MLDEAGTLHHNEFVMIQRKFFMRFFPACVALTGSVAMLTSCGDDPGVTKEPARQTAENQTKEVQETSNVEQKDALASTLRLFADRTVFDLGDKLRVYASSPEVQPTVRVLHELTENYLTELSKDEKATPEEVLYRIRVECKLGDLRSDLGAYDRAAECYRHVHEVLQTLPEDMKTRTDVCRVQSAAYAGLAYLSIVKNDLAKALEYADEALKIDFALSERLAPKDGGVADSQYEEVVADLMGSYKVKGDILVLRDDPEEAKDTYKKSVRLAERLKQGSPTMGRRQITVLSALGDVEKRMGNEKQAKAYWISAARICSNISKMPQRDADTQFVKAQIVNDFKGLKVRIENTVAEGQTHQQNVTPPVDKAQEPAPEVKSMPEATATSPPPVQPEVLQKKKQPARNGRHRR